MKTLLLLLVALLVQGCATQNTPGTADYALISNSQVIGELPSVKSSPENIATIIVKRDRGFSGAALSSVLTIDGRRIAKIKPAQYLELYLPEREYLFGVDWSDGMGPVATSTTRELAVDCRAGRTYYLRMFPQIGNGIIIERTSQ